MSAAKYRAIRQVNDHLEGMARRPGANATDDWRLAVMRRRAAVRVEAAAMELAGSAQAENATAALRGLAAMVRSGAVTWQECVLGRADHLPEVQAWVRADQDSESPKEIAQDEPARKKPRVNRGAGDDDDGELTVFGSF